MRAIRRTSGMLILAMTCLSGFATIPRATMFTDDGLWTEVIRGTAATSGIGSPVLLSIPSIGVTAPVEFVGLTEDNKMENPSDWQSVGWYELGPRPGEDGNAVIAGHLDSYDGPAVFWDLQKLLPGDVIEIVDEHETIRQYTVDSIVRYRTKDAPLEDIFARHGRSRIVLITCDGVWRKNTGYDERFIVFAEEKETVLPSVSFIPPRE